MAGPVNNAKATHHEHPTPQSVIEAAHQVMGWINLDPASSRDFNERVRAAFYYTKEQNGFTKNWYDAQTIFLNPPGSQSTLGQPKNPSCHQWLDKLVETKQTYLSLEQAIYVGYNGPETLSRRPWHCRSADAVLWTSVEGTATEEEGFIKSSGRVKFASDRPYFPSIILYFGWNSEGFREYFAKFGTFLEVC
ncbi:MAG: DNA N-6-adenine-methyltransferase [Microcoleus sp.]